MHSRRTRIALTMAMIFFQVAAARAQVADPEKVFGRLEAEVDSKFSKIRIRRKGDIRTMLFVRDTGDEIGESQMNLRTPHHLLIPYTQLMFVSYLYKPKQERILLVGLGGGAMVRFWQHHLPNVRLDVVEIDPEVVELASSQFGAKPSDNVRIITADGAEFLKSTKTVYDAIYMDAFLKPSAETDATGAPLRLKTEQFYRDALSKVAPDGLMVFNINEHADVDDDLRALRAAFKSLQLYRASKTNLIAVGLRGKPLSPTKLRANARKLDRSFQGNNFSLQRMLSKRTRSRR